MSEEKNLEKDATERPLQAVVRPRVAKCEDCGGDTLYIDWPAGWSQCGGSKYGKTYEEDGLAWHCPSCRSEAV